MAYSIDKITVLIGARRVGDAPAEIGWLLTDSRSLCFPEETLFFALRSARNDGHRYVQDLYHRGVFNFVVERLPEQHAVLFPKANFLIVTDTLHALQRLAERHRESFDIPVVGITGSNGKTVVKEWLYQLLSTDKTIVRSPRSYNSQIGVPLSVWGMTPHAELALFEAGISQVGEMKALRNVIQPTIGIFTFLGNAHQEHFHSMEEKCIEKLHLFKNCTLVIYPADDAVLHAEMERQFYGRSLGWSMTNEAAPLYVSSIEHTAEGTRISYRYQSVQGQYVLPFIDAASISNSISCLALCLHLGLDEQTIAERMALLEPVAMRLEVKEGRNGCTLINDSYNSDLNSLDIALDFMNRRTDSVGRKRTLILSDVHQVGEKPELFYGKVADLVRSRGIDKFIGVGMWLKDYADNFTMESYFFDDTTQLMQSDVFKSLRNEVVLIKGARAYRFDEVSEQLELKVHETILEVNLNAVVDNLNYYRSRMQPNTKVVCMVKASAYGAGAVEVGKTLQDHQVDYLAVAVADEGAELRKTGITTNIMVMNPEMTAFKTLFEYELEPEIYSFRLLDALIKAAEKEGITHYPVHIKLDTGMHRLGFDPIVDMPKLIERLQHQTALMPRSVFSHFVGSDSDDFDRFSERQYQLFLQGSEALQQAYHHKILRHMCNSAAIDHFPERHLDMVRLGLGLYGVNARTNEMLHNVSTLKTTILQIRTVPKEETVGYSRRGRLLRDSRIAALPIGYADGLDRRFGNGNAYCLVNGQKAPYVGNICMDVCMIDVTDIDCREGDSVIIFGESLPVTVLSDVKGTIPYEVLTSVSSRVKRVYFKD